MLTAWTNHPATKMHVAFKSTVEACSGQSAWSWQQACDMWIIVVLRTLLPNHWCSSRSLCSGMNYIELCRMCIRVFARMFYNCFWILVIWGLGMEWFRLHELTWVDTSLHALQAGHCVPCNSLGRNLSDQLSDYFLTFDWFLGYRLPSSSLPTGSDGRLSASP